jgi:hypothetical protein
VLPIGIVIRGMEHLEGDHAAQVGLLGAEDGPCGTLAEALEEHESSEGGDGERFHAKGSISHGWRAAAWASCR